MLLTVVVLSSSAAGCGGKDGAPTATRTVAAPAPATTTVPAPGTTTEPPTATTGVPVDGDQEAERVPAAFAVQGGAITPVRVTVPAFLTIELRITARRAPATVTVALPGGPRRLDVAAGGTARRRIAGLRPGDYAVTVAGGGHALLHVVAGGEPGP